MKKDEGAFTCSRNDAGNMKYFNITANVPILSIREMPELLKELTELGLNIKTPPNTEDQYLEYVQIDMTKIIQVDQVAIQSLEIVENSVDSLRIVNVSREGVFNLLKMCGFKVARLTI